MTAPKVLPSRPVSRVAGEPFRNAAAAWFWTMSALTARHNETGKATNGRGVPRPCDPDDVVRSLDKLYQAGRIRLAHIRVLRVWGDRGVGPDPTCAAERAESALWREALESLEWPLRIKGIVA